MSIVTKQDLFEAGLQMRKEVLGDAYAERTFAVEDEFTADVQDYLTTHAWGRSGPAAGRTATSRCRRRPAPS
jgi:hypothetical protein